MSDSDLFTLTSLLKQREVSLSQLMTPAPSSAHQKAFAPKLRDTIGRYENFGPFSCTFLLDESQQELVIRQTLWRESLTHVNINFILGPWLWQAKLGEELHYESFKPCPTSQPSGPGMCYCHERTLFKHNLVDRASILVNRMSGPISNRELGVPLLHINEASILNSLPHMLSNLD